MPKRDKKGIILLIVIGVILAIVILSTVILRIVDSQSRLTHHQVSRIQAQYAAQAGMVYALEMLRIGIPAGGWGYSVAPAVNSCPNSAGCLVTDLDFPPPVINKQVRVIFCPAGVTCQYISHPCAPPLGYNFCINSTAEFTYTP